MAIGAGCADEYRRIGGSEAEAESEGEPCTPGETRCSANVFQTCGDGGEWAATATCPEACHQVFGCVECAPGSTRCDGNDVVECSSVGTWGGVVTTCDPAAGDTCAGGSCANACDAAAASQSYIGCEYWPTVTINHWLGILGGDFDFGVAVGNPNAAPVDVTVERGEATVATATIAPGDVATIVLPWVPELHQSLLSGYPAVTVSSVRVDDGAYRLSSTLPVSAYQFNPLQYAVGDVSFSYSNDASLLLPTTGLGRDYLAIARPSWSALGTPAAGFVAVAATEDMTTVIVRFTAYTEPGAGLDAYAPGETATFALDRGDVLELLSAVDFTPEACGETGKGEACTAGRDHDLTGTLIGADKPVAVFGGHDCTMVPYDRWCCDHLEEQMFPRDTWGSSVVAVSTVPLATSYPNVWRLVSGSQANTVAFEPPILDGVTLDEGEFVEFEYQGAFRVESTTMGRIALAQFMVGEDYNGPYTPPDVGDPAMALAVPYEQFRTGYQFLTPSTYIESWVHVIAPMASPPTLDGASLPALEAIGSTGFGWVNVEVEPGAHVIESPIDPQPFGIMVSGVAPYTSYLYAGGLDLESLPIQ